MATQIKLRRDTAANWSVENPVLASGEPGLDTTNNILKIGNGIDDWNSLDSIYDPSTNIIPSADNTYDLGSPSKQWRHIYTAGGSIYLDDIKLTNNAGKLEITKVINPGEETEELDPTDSNAGSNVTQKLVNGEHEFALENDGTLSLDGDPFTSNGGGSISVGNGQGPSVQNVTEILFNGTVTEVVPGVVGVSITATSPVTEEGTFSTLPDFLDFTTGTSLKTGQTSEGIFFSGNASGSPSNPEESSVSYPIRTNFTIPGNTKVVVTIDMVVNDECSDFGLCVFEDSVEPEWQWGTNTTRIAAQYNCTSPEIDGLTSGAGEGVEGWQIPGPGTYRVRFTYQPGVNPDVILETLDTNNNVLNTIEYTESLNQENAYRIGFAADQDSDESNQKLRTYIKNLTINIDDGATVYTDTLMLGGGAGGVDGLSGNTDYTPEQDGDQKYQLNINNDINLRTYQQGTGQDNFGPGFSLGQGIGDPHRSGVIAIGNNDVGYNSKPLGVYIGYQAGWNDSEGPQGESAVAIGAYAARNFALDNSITINATGEHLDPDESGLFIKPIREEQYDDQVLFYNPNSGEVTYAANNFGTPELTDDKEVKITVGNTNYFAIVNRTNPDGDTGVDATAVAYDNAGDIITLHVSQVNIDGDNIDRLIVTKIDNTENIGTTLWQKQIDQDVDVDTVHDVAIDADDNIVIALSADNGNADDTIVLIKLAQLDGSVIWKQDYHGVLPVSVTEGDFTLVSTTLGSGQHNGQNVQTVYIQGLWPQLTGFTFRSSDGSPTFTNIGTIVYAMVNSETEQTVLFFAEGTFGGDLDGGLYYSATGLSPNSHLEVGAVVVNGDNIFVAGYYNDDNNNGEDSGYLMKVALADGTLTWAQSFDVGPGFTRLFGMDVGADGNPVVVGTGESGGPNGAVVVKLSGTDGSPVWASSFFDSENASITYEGGDVVVDSQNNVYVSVNTYQPIVHEIGNNTTVTIAYITKINSSGTRQWTRRVGPGPCASIATGIDCDDTGNVYLSALTTAQKNSNRDIDNFLTNDNKNILVIAKYSPSNTVLWQRYIDCDSYWFSASANESGGPPGQYNPGANRGRNLSIGSNGKMAVQVSVVKKDANDYIWDSAYTESITFQIDQDGREMTVGSGSEKFTVRASRIPGKIITPQYTLFDLEEYSLPISEVTEDIAVTTAPQTFSDGEMAQQVAKSAPYEYVFGNDGTLTIPNDGDLKLVQTQIGWFSIYGPIKNDYDNVDIRASVVDPSDGSVYAVGESDSNGQGFLTRYNSSGEILWSVRFNDNDAGNNNRANAVKIHPVTGNVMVLLEYYGVYTYTLVVEVDPDTAKVVNSFGLRDDNESGATTAYDFAFTTLGDLVLVGRKNDEYQSVSVTAYTGSTTGVLFFTRATAPTINTNWYVSGTGIIDRTPIDNIDRYPGLVSTTNGSGTGCVATIDFNSDGSVNGVNSFTAGGENYQVGDVLTFAGTQFPGGTSPANDITMTIIDNSAPNGGVNGTNNIAGTIPTTYVRVATTIATPDYGQIGNTYAVLQPVNGEAFVWMGGFQKTLSAGGEYDSERYLSVALDIDNNIYAAGEMIARNGAAGGDLNNYWCAVVTKINNDGTHAWTKALNDNLNDCYAKCVAVSVPGSTVAVVHENSNGWTTVTKLDTGGNIKWQRKTTSLDDSSVAIDNNGDIYAVIEANFENKFDDVAKVIRFNSVGEIVWRKFLGHLSYDYNGASIRFKNGRNLTLDADNLYISGYTYAQENYYRNGVVIKIPKTGDNDGFYGNWALQQEMYDVDKINTTEATTFTPTIGTGSYGLWNPNFGTQWWDPSDNSYYHTLWEMKDRDGGAIEFADGTRQTRSAQMIPQKRIDNGMNHRLTLEDMGGQIYFTTTYNGTTVHIPYHWDNPLPIGYTVVIVNNSGDTINIDADGINMTIIVPGIGSGQYWDLQNQGMATLLKVDNDIWFLTGNVTDDN